MRGSDEETEVAGNRIRREQGEEMNKGRACQRNEMGRSRSRYRDMKKEKEDARKRETERR